MSFKNFLNFEKMISGSIIKILYWLGLVIIVLFVLASLSGSINTMSWNGALGLLQFVVALLGGVLAALFWRVICEMYLTFLSMNERLGQIRDKLPGA